MKLEKDPEPRVIALVCLLDYAPKDRHNFGYKDMDEGMGPNEDQCPERILRMLTPLRENDGRYTKEWRERCWARLARPKIRHGMLIRFSEPILGAGGHYREDTFRVETEGRRRIFVGQHLMPGSRWRLDNHAIQNKAWDVVQSEPAKITESRRVTQESLAI